MATFDFQKNVLEKELLRGYLSTLVDNTCLCTFTFPERCEQFRTVDRNFVEDFLEFLGKPEMISQKSHGLSFLLFENLAKFAKKTKDFEKKIYQSIFFKAPNNARYSNVLRDLSTDLWYFHFEYLHTPTFQHYHIELTLRTDILKTLEEFQNENLDNGFFEKLKKEYGRVFGFDTEYHPDIRELIKCEDGYEVDTYGYNPLRLVLNFHFYNLCREIENIENNSNGPDRVAEYYIPQFNRVAVELEKDCELSKEKNLLAGRKTDFSKYHCNNYYSGEDYMVFDYIFSYEE